jgi:hypothetical protein
MHCHIFHHAGLGMMSELDVLPAGATDVSDRPTPAADDPMLAAWHEDRLTFGVIGAAPSVTVAAVYDVSGREVDRTEFGVLTEGLHRMTWSLGTRLESGLYFLRAGTPGHLQSARFAVLR